ncbi:magnesium transporter MgtE N-terminal domain-containing protein [Chroococcidiopsis sp. TS-821]|uniref:magnesium transporter MgtE N-terminal domain-containing protein n=1 Tax=Chroococcidiopsis sp. TS-821 TaxID=1378066 RepID=UPI000CEE20C8|nr:hypothetical protein [Chroococcidiopsis sp. TS-821]PPS41501.1 hypothetical protein B1A85_17275 [Chroococcidiopsis sp. TS-821]
MSQMPFQAFTQQLASYLSVSATARTLTEDLKQRILALQILGEGLAAIVLDDLPPKEQAEILQAMEASELIGVLEAMEPERRYRLLAGLPTEVIEQLMANLRAEFQITLHWLFGNLMTQPAAMVDKNDCGD